MRLYASSSATLANSGASNVGKTGNASDSFVWKLSQSREGGRELNSKARRFQYRRTPHVRDGRGTEARSGNSAVLNGRQSGVKSVNKDAPIGHEVKGAAGRSAAERQLGC